MLSRVAAVVLLVVAGFTLACNPPATNHSAPRGTADTPVLAEKDELDQTIAACGKPLRDRTLHDHVAGYDFTLRDLTYSHVTLEFEDTEPDSWVLLGMRRKPGGRLLLAIPARAETRKLLPCLPLFEYSR